MSQEAAGYRYGYPLGGSSVPDAPPFAAGALHPLREWWCFLTVSAVGSAMRAHAIVGEKAGPRGGTWYRATYFWGEWRAKYVKLCATRDENHAVKDARDRMMGMVSCSSCRWLHAEEVIPAVDAGRMHAGPMFVYSCGRLGKGGKRRIRYSSQRACEKFYEPKG